MDFQKWSVLRQYCWLNGAQNCYATRVLCFLRKLGCQKLICTNILGGDRVRLCPGRISNSYDLQTKYNDFLVVAIIETDHLSCFSFRNTFPKSHRSIMISKNRHSRPNWRKLKFRANTNSEIWAGSCIVGDFAVVLHSRTGISLEDHPRVFLRVFYGRTDHLVPRGGFKTVKSEISPVNAWHPIKKVHYGSLRPGNN